MIKAVFFDLYHTLVRYEPPREELEAEALQELGIKANPADLRLPLISADEYFYQEIARQPLNQRSRDEKMELYARYQGTVLEKAGIAPEEKTIMGLLGKMQQLEMELALFDDVIPTLDTLKERGMVLGLISNVETDMTDTFRELGLATRLDIIVTSQETGFNKPRPEIFHEALKRGGVLAKEAIYIGDQYQVDYLGATDAGMKGILLDRFDYHQKTTGCTKVKSLEELVNYL